MTAVATFFGTKDQKIHCYSLFLVASSTKVELHVMCDSVWPHSDMGKGFHTVDRQRSWRGVIGVAAVVQM